MFLRGSRVPTQITGPSAGTASLGVQSGAPFGQVTMRAGSTPSRATTCAATVSDTVTTRIGVAGVRGHQARIVPPDFRGGRLGMVQEEQVVNGHDLRGPRCRQQQRRGGVRHVDSAGHPFDRRPPEAMPGPIEHPDRHAGIVAADPCARSDESVLPAAGEHGHLVARRGRGPQREHRPMHVLADAGPRAQRRSIVEQHPHGTYASVRRSATRRPPCRRERTGLRAVDALRAGRSKA